MAQQCLPRCTLAVEDKLDATGLLAQLRPWMNMKSHRHAAARKPWPPDWFNFERVFLNIGMPGMDRYQVA
jgi:hypothetical protein